MYTHHDRPYRAPRLEDQNPEAIKEQNHSKRKLHSVPKRPYEVDAVVQMLPEGAAIRDEQEERVNSQRDQDLDYDLDPENRDREQPSADGEARPQKAQKTAREEYEEGADGQSAKMPMKRGVVGSAERHEQRVHDVVDKVENGGEEEAKVAKQSHEALVSVQTGQSGLQGQDVEEDGGYGAEALFLLVLGEEDPLEEAADVVADEGDDAGHAEDGGEGLAAVDQESSEGEVEAEVFAVVTGEDLEELLADAEEPEGAEDGGDVESGPFGLDEGGQAEVADEVAGVAVVRVDDPEHGRRVVPEDKFADREGQEGGEDGGVLQDDGLGKNKWIN